jgi:hypothetical protein
VRDHRCGGAAHDPSDDRPDRRERDRFGEREELDLPASRAEPRQAASRIGDVAA